MFDAYMLIDGVNDVQGEATTAGYEEQIVILSYSHSVSNTSQAVTTGKASAGTAVHGDFNVNKELDAASPKLDEYCSQGMKIPKVIVTLVASEGDDQTKPFMFYTLEDVRISSVTISGAGGGGTPSESVTFNYGKIAWKYIQTSRKPGEGDKPKEGVWDLRTKAKA